MRLFYEGMVELGLFLEEKFLGLSEFHFLIENPWKTSARGAFMSILTPRVSRKFLEDTVLIEIRRLRRRYFEHVCDFNYQLKGGKIGRLIVFLTLRKFKEYVYGPSSRYTIEAGSKPADGMGVAKLYQQFPKMPLLPGDRVFVPPSRAHVRKYRNKDALPSQWVRAVVAVTDVGYFADERTNISVELDDGSELHAYTRGDVLDHDDYILLGRKTP